MGGRVVVSGSSRGGVRYSPACRRLPECCRNGTTLRPWSPSGRGCGSASAPSTPSRSRATASGPRCPREKRYVLEMLPYPSGDIHIGHFRNYTIGDVVARFERMRGRDVLPPLRLGRLRPAGGERRHQARHPPRHLDGEEHRGLARHAAAHGALLRLGAEVVTCRADYYKFTQWMFLLLHRRGLAYRALAAVNWCPVDQTVLANEHVVNGCCWRHPDVPVEKRELEQWFFRITKYAQRLLDDLDKLTAGPRARCKMQRSWIGRSEGAEVTFAVRRARQRPWGGVTVFTTRPDTLWGATFLTLAPEHPLVGRIVSADCRADVEEYVARARKKSDIERSDLTRQKDGVFTGAYGLNPVTHDPVPIWVADYVLGGYGTGAIMGVPAHDQRDFEFAQAYGLPLKVVVQPADAGGGARRRGDDRGVPGRRRHGELAAVRRHAGARGHPARHRLARGARHRPRQGAVPPPRLADQPAALLGLPDPDGALPAVRRRAGARGAAAGEAPRAGGELHPRRPLAARGRCRVHQHPLPAVRRAGAARPRHHGHLRRLVLVPPALLDPQNDRGPFAPARRRVAAHRPLHRRRRARHRPPALLPLLHQGAVRRRVGAGRRAGARLFTTAWSPTTARRDVEVEGQRGRRRASSSSATASTCRGWRCSSSRRRRPRSCGARRGSRARGASSTACGGWWAASTRARRSTGPRSPRWRATTRRSSSSARPRPRWPR